MIVAHLKTQVFGRRMRLDYLPGPLSAQVCLVDSLLVRSMIDEAMDESDWVLGAEQAELAELAKGMNVVLLRPESRESSPSFSTSWCVPNIELDANWSSSRGIWLRPSLGQPESRMKSSKQAICSVGATNMLDDDMDEEEDGGEL